MDTVDTTPGAESVESVAESVVESVGESVGETAAQTVAEPAPSGTSVKERKLMVLITKQRSTIKKLRAQAKLVDQRAKAMAKDVPSLAGVSHRKLAACALNSLVAPLQRYCFGYDSVRTRQGFDAWVGATSARLSSTSAESSAGNKGGEDKNSASKSTLERMTAKAARLKALLARSQAAVARLRENAETAKSASRNRETALRGNIEALKEDRQGMESAIRAAALLTELTEDYDIQLQKASEGAVHSLEDVERHEKAGSAKRAKAGGGGGGRGFSSPRAKAVPLTPKNGKNLDAAAATVSGEGGGAFLERSTDGAGNSRPVNHGVEGGHQQQQGKDEDEDEDEEEDEEDEDIMGTDAQSTAELRLEVMQLKQQLSRATQERAKTVAALHGELQAAKDTAAAESETCARASAASAASAAAAATAAASVDRERSIRLDVEAELRALSVSQGEQRKSLVSHLQREHQKSLSALRTELAAARGALLQQQKEERDAAGAAEGRGTDVPGGMRVPIGRGGGGDAQRHDGGGGERASKTRVTGGDGGDGDGNGDDDDDDDDTFDCTKIVIVRGEGAKEEVGIQLLSGDGNVVKAGSDVILPFSIPSRHLRHLLQFEEHTTGSGLGSTAIQYDVELRWSLHSSAPGIGLGFSVCAGGAADGSFPQLLPFAIVQNTSARSPCAGSVVVGSVHAAAAADNGGGARAGGQGGGTRLHFRGTKGGGGGGGGEGKFALVLSNAHSWIRAQSVSYAVTAVFIKKSLPLHDAAATPRDASDGIFVGGNACPAEAGDADLVCDTAALTGGPLSVLSAVASLASSKA